MSMYVANSFLHALTLEAVRYAVPSVRGLEVVPVGTFLVPGNWRVASLDVPPEHAAVARAEADAVEADGRWVWVPDDHPLDGLPFGWESGGQSRSNASPPSNPDDHPLLALAETMRTLTGKDYVSAIMRQEKLATSQYGGLITFVRAWRAGRRRARHTKA